MSPRDMKLPLLALIVMASNGHVQAAVQSTAISDLSTPAHLSSANFLINPIASDAIAAGSTVKVYFSGELNASLRCVNIDGCGPAHLAFGASFKYTFADMNGSFATQDFPLRYVDYGPTSYGETLHLKSIPMASDPYYWPDYWARIEGLIADPSKPGNKTSGSLSFQSTSLWNSSDFDQILFTFSNPTFNIQYSPAVPEPGTYAMAAVGLAALSVVRRRTKSAR